MSHLKIVETDDRLTHVALAGKLDLAAVGEMEKEFTRFVDDRHRPAIVDLSNVEFIASIAIGLLVASARALKRYGHAMVVLNPQPLVERALRSPNVHLLIPITHDRNEALGLLKVDATT